MCSLLAWAVIWDLPVTDAGGPPVRLAVERQVTRFVDQTEEELSATTQLIPTEWDRSPELIPTDIDRQKVQWVRRDLDNIVPLDDLDFHARPGAYHFIYDNLNELLDRHFSMAPLRPVRAVSRDDDVAVIAPWVAGERPTEVMLGIKSENRFDPKKFGRTKGLPNFDVEDCWIPAEQWWPRLLARQKSPD